jgi:hypothetical protein
MNQDGFLGVQSVVGLGKDPRMRTISNLIRYFLTAMSW